MVTESSAAGLRPLSLNAFSLFKNTTLVYYALLLLLSEAPQQAHTSSSDYPASPLSKPVSYSPRSPSTLHRQISQFPCASPLSAWGPVDKHREAQVLAASGAGVRNLGSRKRPSFQRHHSQRRLAPSRATKAECLRKFTRLETSGVGDPETGIFQWQNSQWILTIAGGDSRSRTRISRRKILMPLDDHERPSLQAVQAVFSLMCIVHSDWHND